MWNGECVLLIRDYNPYHSYLLAVDFGPTPMGKCVKKNGWIMTQYKETKNGKTIVKLKKVRRA